MKVLKLFPTLLFLFITIDLLGCHNVTITQTNAVDNGDGTYTYTFEVCMGIEDTYGFYLDFGGGANIVSYTTSITSPSTGVTINASFPPVSGNGMIEFGDWDNSSNPVFSGATNDCISISVTFDDAIDDATVDGTQAFYSGGPCSGSTSAVTSCFQSMSDYAYTINITTDNYGNETTWDIIDQSNGSVVASGGPYDDNTSYSIDLCLPDGCYDFVIYDSFGDGICCSYGNGSYEVVDNNGNIVASGGDFGSSETTDINCFILPVELISFSAQEKKEAIHLEWITKAEYANDHFILERSRDGKYWDQFARIEGKGNTNSTNIYSELDKDPFLGVNYYRLKQVDMDGSSETFAPVSVRMNGQNDPRIFPNPTHQELSFESQQAITSVKVLSIKGAVIKTFGRRTTQVKNKTLDLSELSQGIYYLQLETGKEIFQKKFVIQ